MGSAYTPMTAAEVVAIVLVTAALLVYNLGEQVGQDPQLSAKQPPRLPLLPPQQQNGGSAHNHDYTVSSDSDDEGGGGDTDSRQGRVHVGSASGADGPATTAVLEQAGSNGGRVVLRCNCVGVWRIACALLRKQLCSAFRHNAFR